MSLDPSGAQTTMMHSRRVSTSMVRLLLDVFATVQLSLSNLVAGSHILTVDHDLHRLRRKPLEPFFSRNGVQRLHGMLTEVTLKMESRLREFQNTSHVVRLDHVFGALASDVMCRICVASTADGEKRPDFLDHPDFSPEWYVRTLQSRPSQSAPKLMAHPPGPTPSPP